MSSSSQEDKPKNKISGLFYRNSSSSLPVSRSISPKKQRNRSNSCDDSSLNNKKVHPLASKLARYSSDSNSSSCESLKGIKKKKKKKNEKDLNMDIEEITIDDDQCDDGINHIKKKESKKNIKKRKEQEKMLNKPEIPITPSIVSTKSQLNIPPTSSVLSIPIAFTSSCLDNNIPNNRQSIRIMKDSKSECDYSSSIEDTKDIKKLKRKASLSNLNYTSITKKTIIENQSELCQYNRLLNEKIISNEKEIKELHSIINEMKKEQYKNMKKDKISDYDIISNEEEEEEDNDSDETKINALYDTLFCLNQDKCTLF